MPVVSQFDSALFPGQGQTLSSTEQYPHHQGAKRCSAGLLEYKLPLREICVLAEQQGDCMGRQLRPTCRLCEIDVAGAIDLVQPTTACAIGHTILAADPKVKDRSDHLMGRLVWAAVAEASRAKRRKKMQCRSAKATSRLQLAAKWR
jgi:hypothetical protein